MSSRATGWRFLADPGEEISKQIPCGALQRGNAGRTLPQENSDTVADSGFLLGMLNRLTSVSRQLCPRSAQMGAQIGKWPHFPLDIEGVCLGRPAVHSVFVVFLP